MRMPGTRHQSYPSVKTYREESHSNVTEVVRKRRQDHIHRLHRYNLFKVLKARIAHVIVREIRDCRISEPTHNGDKAYAHNKGRAFPEVSLQNDCFEIRKSMERLTNRNRNLLISQHDKNDSGS